MKTCVFHKITVILVFVLMITAPVFCMNRQRNKVSPTENRYLSNFPAIFMDDGSFTPQLREKLYSWFKDNLGFRVNMVALTSWIKFHLLHLSPSQAVEIGKDGWYFYTNDSNMKIVSQQYPGFNERELSRICAQQKRIQEKLRRQNIDYVLVLPPSKVSIYPEKIASGNYTVCDTPVDMLADYLETHSDLKVVRLKQALLKAKNTKKELLYFKTDTHWSQYGAYIAYCEIIDKLNKWKIVDSIPAEFVFAKGTFIKGEFGGMMGNPSLISEENCPDVLIKQPHAIPVTSGVKYDAFLSALQNENIHTAGHMYHNNNKTAGHRVLMYGDSFFCGIAGWNATRYLAENFLEFYDVWDGNIQQEMIDTVKPSLVIYEITERFLNTLSEKSIAFTQNYLTDPQAEEVSQTVPARVKIGSKTNFEVTVRNSGTQTWYKADLVRAGLFINGSDSGIRADLSDDIPVKSGESVTFTFKKIVPRDTDRLFEFQMLQEGVAYFGERILAHTKVVY